MRRLSLLPLMPIAGEGQAAFQPIWAPTPPAASWRRSTGEAAGRRIELAGPETLTYDDDGPRDRPRRRGAAAA